VSFFCFVAAIVSQGGYGPGQNQASKILVLVVESPAKIGSKIFVIFMQHGMVEMKW
jgi:hypothetical protein